MDAIPPSWLDRSGWTYESVRGCKRWRVVGLTPFGWHLWPVDQHVGTQGGVKGLFRSRDELDDNRKWIKVGASLYPFDAIKALELIRTDRECNRLDAKQIHRELICAIRNARNARLKWHEIAEAAGVSRSYVMRVWKESNGEKNAS